MVTLGIRPEDAGASPEPGKALHVGRRRVTGRAVTGYATWTYHGKDRPYTAQPTRCLPVRVFAEVALTVSRWDPLVKALLGGVPHRVEGPVDVFGRGGGHGLPITEHDQVAFWTCSDLRPYQVQSNGEGMVVSLASLPECPVHRPFPVRHMALQ